MKKLLAIFAIVALALVGCEKKPNSGNNNNNGNTGADVEFVGEWKLMEWNNEVPEFMVYIAFNKDNTFEIYQQVWSLDYELFKGTYKVSGDIVTGTYDNGNVWASGYKYAVEKGKLMMYSQENQSVKSVYEKCEIPEEVKTEATTTRSSEVVPFL